MNAAAAQPFQARGERGILDDLEVLERLTTGDGPSARERLEHELGDELAAFLVVALTSARERRPCLAGV
jgi:predicted Ser/Thr protein kinase